MWNDTCNVMKALVVKEKGRNYGGKKNRSARVTINWRIVILLIKRKLW